MSKIKKGGIATVITVVILVGLVVALLVNVVVPMTNKTHDIGQTGADKLSDLQASMEA